MMAENLYIVAVSDEEGETFEKKLENTLNVVGGDATVVWLSDGFIYMRTPDGVLRAPFDVGEFEEVKPCGKCGK